MKKIIVLILLTTLSVSAQNELLKIASFKGAQVTGVTVSDKGRVFANFPRWREGIPFSVVEIFADGTYKPYPNTEINSWKSGEIWSDKLISVQSVVAFKEELYIIDTANPQFKGILTQPKLYVYDLNTNSLKKTYVFPETVIKKNSYVNDLRVDSKKGKIYFTDSGAAGIIILDTKTNKFLRVLDNHPFTRAETDHLTINNTVWKNTIHSDGIALDTKNDILYFHALSGYTLYGIPTENLLNPASLETVVPFKIKTAAPYGMIMDSKGNLYFADLENHKIQYLTPDRKTIKTLFEGESIKWADTFSIYDDYLYFTNSRIHEVKEDISTMEFPVYKIKLP